MQYCLVPSIQPAADKLKRDLHDQLAGGKTVLWLVSGGSNIAVTVNIINAIPAGLHNNLTIALVDERYGPIGHADSNWQQLVQAGLATNQLKSIPVLTDGGLDLAATADVYQDKLEQAYAQHDWVIGSYGMGGDGHLAGILPHSPAVAAKGLVTSYVTPEYSRITTTFTAIKRCERAYLFCFGEAKRIALEHLQQDLSLNDQPAQILKQVPIAYVYNDLIGETI